MDSASFQTSSKKGDSGLMDVEVMKLRKHQKHLLGALAVLLLLSLFCVAMVIWLAVEVSEDNDDNGGGVRDASSESVIPSTNRASTLNVFIILPLK